MRIRIDDQLRREAERFAFRYACEDCAHAAGPDPVLRCSLGYPAAPRRDALDGAHFEPCKTFELGP
jgi:hypothetical protein